MHEFLPVFHVSETCTEIKNSALKYLILLNKVLKGYMHRHGSSKMPRLLLANRREAKLCRKVNLRIKKKDFINYLTNLRHIFPRTNGPVLHFNTSLKTKKEDGIG